MPYIFISRIICLHKLSYRNSLEAKKVEFFYRTTPQTGRDKCQQSVSNSRVLLCYLEAKVFSIRFTLHTCIVFSVKRCLNWSSFCCWPVVDFLTPFEFDAGTTLFDTPFLPNNRSWFWCVSTVIVDSVGSFDCCSDEMKEQKKFFW